MKREFKILTLLMVSVFTFAVLSPAFCYRVREYCDYDYDYPSIYDAYWSNNTACWSVSGFANKYEVILYRGGTKIVTRTVYSRSIDFTSYINRFGYEYYFEVRPYNKYTGWGNFVMSNYKIVRDRHCYDDYYYDNERYFYDGDISYAVNPGPPYTANVDNNNPWNINNNNNFQNQNNINNFVAGANSITVQNPQVLYENSLMPSGSFIQSNGIWYYGYLNGVFATNTWVQSNGKWYYFDASGKMLIGLYTINGKTYYFNLDGSMLTGTVVWNGITHYFDANGVMIY